MEFNVDETIISINPDSATPIIGLEVAEGEILREVDGAFAQEKLYILVYLTPKGEVNYLLIIPHSPAEMLVKNPDLMRAYLARLHEKP